MHSRLEIVKERFDNIEYLFIRRLNGHFTREYITQVHVKVS